MEGIEPSASVLLRPEPNSNFFVGGIGIEPSTAVLSGPRTRAELSAGQAVFLAPYKILAYIVGAEGIEPSTSVLSGQRSTTELCAQNFCTGYHCLPVRSPAKRDEGGN